MSVLQFSIDPLCGYSQTETSKSRFTIIWIKQGRGFYYIDLDRFTVSNDNFHFLQPCIPFHFGPDCEAEGYVISFEPAVLYVSNEAFAGFYRAGSFSVNVSGESLDKIKFGHLIEALFAEYNEFEPQKSRRLNGLLNMLLIYIKGLLPEEAMKINHSRPSQVTTRFYALLEENFPVKKAVAEYANALHVSPEHLTSIVKKLSGYPASHHIRQRIMLEAKRLALYSDKSMKEIAYRLGFEEPAHFSKFFKANCGINFRNYKRTYDRT